jgi:hypothetical protein
MLACEDTNPPVQSQDRPGSGARGETEVPPGPDTTRADVQIDNMVKLTDGGDPASQLASVHRSGKTGRVNATRDKSFTILYKK